jgi:hypothetical protein
MHDIKYFIFNKNNKIIQGAKKNLGWQITKNITEKHYFSKSSEACAPPDHIESASVYMMVCKTGTIYMEAVLR